MDDEDFEGLLCRRCLSFFEKMPARIGILRTGERESEGRAQVVKLYWSSGKRICNGISNIPRPVADPPGD